MWVFLYHQKWQWVSQTQLKSPFAKERQTSVSVAVQQTPFHSQTAGIWGSLRHTGLWFLHCRPRSECFLRPVALWEYWNVLSMYLQSQHTSNALPVCVRLCMSVLVGVPFWRGVLFLSHRKKLQTGKDPQSSTLEVITPGKPIRSTHFSSSKGYGRRQEVTLCFCCSNSQQPTAT